jgi:phage shock protein A
MGLFDRLSSLIKANLNDLISKAEEPEKLLEQSILDMRSQLAKAKQQVAAAIADEKRLRDQAEQEAKQSQEWEQRAMLAIQQNRDDLARQALMRQQEHAEHAEALQKTWQTHSAETEKLKSLLRDLNDKIEEAKRKKNLLLARARRAEAQERIQNTMSGLSEKSAFEAFARMEEKIEQNERKLVASAEIEEEFSGDRLTSDFKRLEKAAGGLSAEARLMELKQKMGMLPAGASPAAKQLPKGAANAAEISDADFEHLDDTTGTK